MTTLSSFKRLAGQLMMGARGELGHVTEAHAFQLDGELTHMFASYTVHFLKEYAANLDDHRFRVGLIYHSTQQQPWGSETLRLTDEAVRMIYPVSAIGSNELTAFQKKKRENSIHFGTELLLTYALKDTPEVPIFLPVLYDRGTILMQYEHQASSTITITESPDTPVIEVLNLVGPAMAARKNLDVFITLKQRLVQTLIKHDARRPVEMKIMESARAPSAVTAPTTPPPTMTKAAPVPAPSFPGASTAPAGPALNTDASSKQWYSPALHNPTSEKLSRFLIQPREYVDGEKIRNFVRFHDLTVDQQKALAASCPTYFAPTNTQLLERGSTDQWNLYLLQGQVELVAADGEKKTVASGTDAARNAIAALKPRKFTVTAVTPVRFLWIHENIVAEIEQKHPGSGLKLM